MRRWPGVVSGILSVSVLWMVGVAMIPVAASNVYPSETIRLVVPFSQDGATDLIFRDVVPLVGAKLGADMEIVNIAGAAAIRGASLVRDAKPDGHTLLGTHQTLLHSYLNGMTPYTHQQFSPVALLTRTVNIPSTWAGHPVQRADQLAAYIHDHPGVVRIGIIPYSTAEFFWMTLLGLLGVEIDDIQTVHFPDTASKVNALLAREIDFAMLDMPSAFQLYQEAALHPLAVAHTARLKGLAETATLQEQGIAMSHTSDRGVFAPKGTPRERLEILTRAFEHVLQDEELARHLEQDYGSFIDFRPLEEYRVFLEQQLEALQLSQRR